MSGREIDVPSGRPAATPTPSPGDPALARLSLNQRTIPSWNLVDVVAACVRAGVPSIGLWREPVAEVGLAEAARIVADAGLRVSSLCRAGFLTAADGDEQRHAITDNISAIDEAATLGAECLAIVPGGIPDGSTDVDGARSRFAAALDELVPVAAERGVRLAVEPLHPMFCADRGVVVTLDEALDLVEPYPVEQVGVVIDTYHVWWDPGVHEAIARAGQRIASYQISDWIEPLSHGMLLSRGMMGDGFIDFVSLGRAVADAGFDGDVEVEIFNEDIWAASGEAVLATTLRRYVQIGAAATDELA